MQGLTNLKFISVYSSHLDCSVSRGTFHLVFFQISTLYTFLIYSTVLQAGKKVKMNSLSKKPQGSKVTQSMYGILHAGLDSKVRCAGSQTSKPKNNTQSAFHLEGIYPYI